MGLDGLVPRAGHHLGRAADGTDRPHRRVQLPQGARRGQDVPAETRSAASHHGQEHHLHHQARGTVEILAIIFQFFQMVSESQKT